MTRFLATLLLAACLAAPALAESAVIMDNHQDKTITLSGADSVTIAGNHNTVRLVGSKGRIMVAGNHNNVIITSAGTTTSVAGNHNDLKHDAAGGAVDMSGNYNNLVLIKKAGRAEPSVTRSGRNNTVTTK